MSLINKTHPPYFEGVIGSHTVTIDYEQAYSDITLWQRSDMSLAATEKISQRYRTHTGDEVWLQYEIGYNIAGEVLYYKKCDHTLIPPEWVPSGVLV